MQSTTQLSVGLGDAYDTRCCRPSPVPDLLIPIVAMSYTDFSDPSDALQFN